MAFALAALPQGFQRVAAGAMHARHQAHMTRDVALLTGRAPGQWRKRN